MESFHMTDPWNRYIYLHDGEFLTCLSYSHLSPAGRGGDVLSMTHPPMIPLSRRLVFADFCHPSLGTDMKYLEILEL